MDKILLNLTQVPETFHVRNPLVPKVLNATLPCIEEGELRN